MSEDMHLDDALSRADDMLRDSLRREESKRARKSSLLVACVTLVIGGVLGSAVTWLLIASRAALPPSAVPQTAPAVAAAAPRAREGFMIVSREIPIRGPVEVKWGSTWRKAVIVERKDDLFLVRYDGWNDFHNEWVRTERMRPIGETYEPGYMQPRQASTQAGP